MRVRISCVPPGQLAVAHAAFVAHVTETLAQPLPPVEVHGIDETRRGRPRWARDPVTLRWSLVHDRWHTAVVDAAGTAGLLAHIDGRTAAAVTEWVAVQTDAWRAAVTHVCIDLSASYPKPVHDALPDALVVADRFHLVQLANTMVTEVRQRTTREGRGRRGTTRDPEWANRRRLLTVPVRDAPLLVAVDLTDRVVNVDESHRVRAGQQPR